MATRCSGFNLVCGGKKRSYLWEVLPWWSQMFGMFAKNIQIYGVFLREFYGTGMPKKHLKNKHTTCGLPSGACPGKVYSRSTWICLRLKITNRLEQNIFGKLESPEYPEDRAKLTGSSSWALKQQLLISKDNPTGGCWYAENPNKQTNKTNATEKTADTTHVFSRSLEIKNLWWHLIPWQLDRCQSLTSGLAECPIGKGNFLGNKGQLVKPSS